MFPFVGRLLVDKGLRELVAAARLLKEEGATVRLRDALIDGETGLLCRPRDIGSLAEAMRKMTALAPAEREAMGRAGRAFMELRNFSEIVLSAYVEGLLHAVRSGPATWGRRD